MRRKDVLIILIPTFIFVIVWVVSSIYHNAKTSTISESVNADIAQISPNFDTKTIDELKKRQAVTPIYDISGSSVQTEVTKTLTTEVPLIGSESATQTATSGGILQ